MKTCEMHAIKLKNLKNSSKALLINIYLDLN